LRPRILDLYCGAGGAGAGYAAAGFDVVGVDHRPQPHYPFTFVEGDALEYLASHPSGFVAVHASPPCQRHSTLAAGEEVELVRPTRTLLRRWGLPYVIENVEGAPLLNPVRICGVGLPGLRVIRHRLFESSVPLTGVPCPEQHPNVYTTDKRKALYGLLDPDTAYLQVTGGGNATVEQKRNAMGIQWMNGRELNQAVPPAYTLHIGRQLLRELL